MGGRTHGDDVADAVGMFGGQRQGDDPAHRIADHGRLRDAECIHELDRGADVIERFLGTGIGFLPTGHVDGIDVEMPGEGLDIAGKVAPSGRARSAAVDQDRA
jgi:hypothetical protein